MKAALTVLLLGLLAGLAAGRAYPLQAQTLPPPPPGSPWSYGSGLLTTCDGMVLTLATYQGTTALNRVSIPYVQVIYDPSHYSPGQLFDHFCLDLMPGPVEQVLYPDGFELRATYIFGNWPTPPAYKYVQRYRFWNDGGFGPWLEVYGPGFGNSASYYVYWRLDPDIAGALSDNLVNWAGIWAQRISEENYPDDGINAPEGNEWGVYDGSRNWYIDPSLFVRDNADFLGLTYKGGELVENSVNTLPHTFITRTELVQNADIVTWYVAHDDTVADNCSPSAACIPGFISKFNGYP